MSPRWIAALAVPLACLGGEVAFHRDVLPVLARRCQSCHRPGEAAPMPLLTYRDARPWAKAIREAVLLKRMPPWFADPAYGKFANDPSLTAAEIRTLVSWADGGALEGPAGGDPPAVPFVDGWRIPKPDAVFSLPEESSVPASGVVDYRYVSVETGFTEDRWVEMAEVRPSNRGVVHHAIVFVSGPGGGGWFGARRYLAGYAPGAVPQIWKPGQARLIPAGSHLVFQMHYTANGKEAVDRTQIGLIFAKRLPRQQIVATTAGTHWFEIPPGDANHRVDAATTMHETVHLVGLRAHMHLRGQSFEFRAVYPTGESRILLRVPRYDFNWQPYYYLETPLLLPKGTRIECTAYYDNSAANPSNPDPRAAVRWGEQSWEEMMLGWIDLAVDIAPQSSSLR
ncbi:MAG: thiol-disulfide isomerase [Candidatus Solibacter usitatus]|nr:thiol-disulfide isomerase [Candidatus Solibacter usitatus]